MRSWLCNMWDLIYVSIWASGFQEFVPKAQIWLKFKLTSLFLLSQAKCQVRSESEPTTEMLITRARIFM
jgi:hypothetical protein